MSTIDRDEKLFEDRGFKRRMGYGARPALVIIDMQKGFTNSEQPLGSNLDDQIEATVPLLAVAHERGIPVFFTACVYEDPDMKDAGVNMALLGCNRLSMLGTNYVKKSPFAAMNHRGDPYFGSSVNLPHPDAAIENSRHQGAEK